MFRTCCRHTCVQLAKKRTSSSSQSTVRSFKECNDVVPFQNLASNEQRLSAHTTKDPVELVKLEFATHGLFETESTRLTVAIHMQIPAFEIVKANYSHFRTTAYKASCQALFHLPAFTLAGVYHEISTNNVVPFRDKLASTEAFRCFVNISALRIKLPASTAGSCGFIAQPGIKRQSHRTC